MDLSNFSREQLMSMIVSRDRSIEILKTENDYMHTKLHVLRIAVLKAEAAARLKDPEFPTHSYEQLSS